MDALEGRAVQGDKARQPVEVIVGGLRRHRLDRKVKSLADGRGDVSKGDALFSVAVIGRVRRTRLQRQPEHDGGITSMDRRPAVAAVIDIG